MNYQVFYNETGSHQIAFKDDKIFVNGKETNVDLVKIADERFHILHQNKSFNLKVEDIDWASKVFTITVNDTVYHLKLEDELDTLMRQMGMSLGAGDEMGDVKAPMPGLVLSILVSEGQEVQKGESLLILEAMKMENVIKATGKGTVKAIKVKQKDAVEKNQVMIEML
jgi:biotin carboxyl carrier protein